MDPHLADLAIDLADLLDAAAPELAAHGLRRVDVRAASDARLGAIDARPRWMAGCVDGDLVATLALELPWREPPWARSEGRASPTERLPAPLRRAARRMRHVRPATLPELARVAAHEVAGLARQRRWPTRPGTVPVASAPTETSPLAVTRFRTIDDALSLVPPALRSAGLVDIGVGDGRVLAEALRLGFGQVSGHELDGSAAARARDLLGPAGEVHLGDALSTPLAPGAVVFLNNPFGIGGVERLARTLADARRPLLVIHVNPPTIAPLEAIGLRLVDHRPTFSILAGPGSAAPLRC